MSNDDIRDALDDLKTSILGIAGGTKDEAREKLVEFSALSESVVLALATDPKMTPELAREAVDNLALATRSALVNAGYALEAKMLDVAVAGVRTALKIIAVAIV